jgi:hypothetical protein
LQKEGVTIREVLEMTCGKCGYVFDESLVKDRISQGDPDVICPRCETRLPISEGAKSVRAGDPAIAQKLFALKSDIEKKKRQEIDEAKRATRSIRCFISYSHRDEELREALEKHLSGLKREGFIEAWNDRMITAGREWAGEIDRNLESARVILLLISADFIASDYCYDKEMTRALEMHASGEARVISIIMRSVDWQTLPFGRLQALPKDGKAVTSWADRDEALKNIAQGVRKAVEELLRPSPGARPMIHAMETDSPEMPIVEPTPYRILHLSDLHYRSSINQGALANGLLKANTQIEIAKAEGRIVKEDSVLRIAVWHHPVTGNEKIAQGAFLDQLRQEDFKLCLHGHVHEDRADIVGYLHPTRKIHIAGAGTFGATATQRPESMPRLYNLIEVRRDHSKVRVHTRWMKKEGKAWDGWAVWPGEKPTERRTYYEIKWH